MESDGGAGSDPTRDPVEANEHGFVFGSFGSCSQKAQTCELYRGAIPGATRGSQRPLIRRTSSSSTAWSSQLSTLGHHLPDRSRYRPRQIGGSGRLIVIPCYPGSGSRIIRQHRPLSTMNPGASSIGRPYGPALARWLKPPLQALSRSQAPGGLGNS